jgi:hypothetical protein
MSKDDRGALIVAALAAALFLPTAVQCGLYLDDHAFVRMLESVSWSQVWTAFVRYVPGRNLHVLWFVALLRLTGGRVWAMHAVSTAFDCADAALVFLLARRATGLRSAAWAAAAIFLVAPNHGETHFWINALPQNQASTFLVLAAFALASRPTRPALGAAVAAFAAALFTYDQVFLLWPLLLAAAWHADARPRTSRYVAAGAGLAALNAAHLTLRYLSPYANGGRPLIRTGAVLRRAYDAAVSVRSGLLPWPTSSHAYWAWSVPVAAAALGAGAWLARTIRDEARKEGPAFVEFSARGWRAPAAFGLAWTVLAYGPNLFWYLSPRHSLLPSAGWALTAAAVGAAAARRRRAAAALPALAALAFAVAAVSDVHEGTQWIDAARLHEAFLAEARNVDPPVESLFLAGAPRWRRRAPAFGLFHDVTFAAARALGRPELSTGDRVVAPTRHGLVYSNDLADVAPDAFKWLPAERANLIVYDPGSRSFSCAASLDLERPDGAHERLPLRPSSRCAAVATVPLETALIASGPEPRPSAPPGTPILAGLILARATLSAAGGNTLLELEWIVVSAPSGPLAYVPRVENASGATLLDSNFPARPPAGGGPLLWPLVDDDALHSGISAGRGLREVFLLRRQMPSAPATLALDVFEIRPDGSAVRAGQVRVPVTDGRM